jgi:hypothetical protein
LNQYVSAVSVRNTEGKKSLGRPRHRLEGNIKIELRETEWEIEWPGFILLRMGIFGRIL